MTEITNLISNVGFPIAVAIACGYFCKYLIDKYTTIIVDALNNLSDKLADYINKNEKGEN